MLKEISYKSHFHSLLYNNNILFIILFTTFHHASADDADVMAKLAKSLNPTPSGWTGTNFCKWTGVSCSSNQVTSINLASKSLTGSLPPEITQLSTLKSLSLQKNQLSGPLPPLSNHPTLEEINLDFNNFDAIPKGFLSGLTSLQTFSISNNTFLPPWNIPDSLRDSTALTSFYATKANVIGEIPDIFESLPSLQSLRLSYNGMTGSLPRSFAKSGIQNLWLNNVGFSGTIEVLGAMAQLRQVWLHVNKFTGSIPDLSACTELYDLQLRDNQLTGVIPDSLTKLSKLTNVALQGNKFQGPMPSFSTNVPVTLGTTNKFCNPSPGPCDPQVTTLLEIVGAMGYPATLADSWEGNDACQNWKFIVCEKGIVTKVNFGRQNWTGTISPSFANLTGLTTISLNDNRLVGTIPTSLTSLRNLELIDISNNNISGKIPPFASSVTVKTSGNEFIGRDVAITYPPGSSPPSLNNGSNVPSSAHNTTKSSISTWVIVVPVIVFVILIAILGLVIYKGYYKKLQQDGKYNEKVDHGKNNVETPSTNTSIVETPMRRSDEIKNDYHVHDGGNIIIPIEVLREATDNFSEDNILGRGGFGIVYKGQLHDGTKIAVKRMESSLINDKGLNEFKAEIEVLTKVRHRNLVGLHGFCDNGNERLLVYECMPQGCLGQHLFDWKEMGTTPLTWSQRVIIALDVARGVEYLHSLAQQSFIHRDLKPSNILLGDDMRAKVSDFGLVKSAPDGNYSLETRLAGTFGYLAPEYAATGRVTTKVDVFAFGVILMEIITGRKALDDSLPDEKSHLVTWFRRFLLNKDAIKAALDPTLGQSFDEDTFQSVLKVAELAGHCTARESYQRPDMGHAVNVLSPLVEQWTPAPDEAGDDSFVNDFHMSLPQVLEEWKSSEKSSSSIMTSGFYDTNNTRSTAGV
ncbi:hypothetical protein RD792_010149 [Penstemon davidsonii]|uniref:Protein kinase domain-containing protein n=1 Tax=Penstemon davidsonii TaxID=160366 RepID=A0ABR0D182_9LAMI|nr:hypothetical protein RD792_010149 [Penstemon davidsonii]